MPPLAEPEAADCALAEMVSTRHNFETTARRFLLIGRNAARNGTQSVVDRALPSFGHSQNVSC